MNDPTQLSPAAQAVLDALDDQFYELNSQHLAAAVVALRTAADQVVPENGDINMLHRVHQSVRYHLLAIATELENHG